MPDPTDPCPSCDCNGMFDPAECGRPGPITWTMTDTAGNVIASGVLPSAEPDFSEALRAFPCSAPGSDPEPDVVIG